MKTTNKIIGLGLLLAFSQLNAQADITAVKNPIPTEKVSKSDTTKTVKSPAVKIEVKSVKALNGSKDDFSPIFFENGLLFCSNSRKVKKGTDPDKVPEDLNLKYVAFDSVGNLTRPTSFGHRTNSKTHEGPSCFNPKRDTMFLTRNMSKGGKDKQNKEGVYTLKIYVKTKDSTGNFVGEKFMAFESEKYSYCHPAMSLDGNRLYFASNMPGGFGGMDLYVVRRLNDTAWTQPINLGPRVNTNKNEIFPYIADSGAFYFSSNGMSKDKERKDLDIYKIDLDNKRAVAQPLQEPINSIADDFGIMFLPNNPQKGFLSSNRKGGVGGDDIYEFEIKVEE
jgi:hypothetical protein